MSGARFDEEGSAEKLVWLPNIMRPYESLASMAVKLCFIAEERPKAFFPRLVKLMGCDLNEVATLTTSRLEKLQSLTAESPKLLRLSGQFPIPAGLDQFLDHAEPQTKRLYFCSDCMAEGYHSTLHQLPWLNRCFRHRTELKAAPRGLAALGFLYSNWFGPTGEWPQRTDPWEWDAFSRSGYLGLVPELLGDVGVICRANKMAGVALQKGAQISASDSARLRVLALSAATRHGAISPSTAALLGTEDFELVRVALPLRSSAVQTLLSRADLPTLVAARLESNLAAGGSSPWIAEMRKGIRAGCVEHSQCIRLLCACVYRWQSIWPHRSEAGRSSEILHDILSVSGLETCPAVRLIERLASMRMADSFRGRRSSPWFSWSNPDQAVGKWLYRSRIIETKRPPPTDPATVRMLDLMVEFWVKTRLSQSLRHRQQDPQAKQGTGSLAEASAGLSGINTSSCEAVLHIDFMNHALFVEENGQGYVLVGMPRVRLAPDSFSAAHFESLKTAVTQIEVASELEWPSDKFVRAGPVPAVLRSRTRRPGDPSPGGLAD